MRIGSALARRRVLVIGACVLALLLGAGALVFEPWRLFTQRTISDTLATPTATKRPEAERPAPPESPAPSASPTPAPAGPIQLGFGEFISHEHETRGGARIVELPNGKRQLQLEGLSTSDGPDLEVWLSGVEARPGVDQWGAAGEGYRIVLGKLAGTHGDQVYPIPDDADLSQIRAVNIWCVRFSVSFGAAPLAS